MTQGGYQVIIRARGTFFEVGVLKKKVRAQRAGRKWAWGPGARRRAPGGGPGGSEVSDI